jgi:chemotaxis protein CheD
VIPEASIRLPNDRRRPELPALPGIRRMRDPETGRTQIKIGPGHYYVTTAQDEDLVTILGSCVAVCMRDPVAGIGGMNHFLLAESVSGEWGGISAATRYGNHAMEVLIDDIIALGGVRSRLEVKIFGGGHVIDSNLAIGQKNVEFAERYLANEGMTIAAKHVGGFQPRRIHYFPPTGKVKMLLLRRESDMAVYQREMEFKRRMQIKPVENNVELFD